MPRPRRRGTKTTRRPDVRPPSWKWRGWQDAPNAKVSTTQHDAPREPSPWAQVEQGLKDLCQAGGVGLMEVIGGGVWRLTLLNGRVLTLVADTDEEARLQRSILGETMR